MRHIRFDDDGTPIYLQIVRNIKAAIISGSLRGGDKMPSVREGAEAYRVNPNTMHRVLGELEREGIIFSTRGVGFFVAEDPHLVAHLRESEAARVTDRFLAELTALGLGAAEVRELVETSLGGANHEHPGRRGRP